MISLDNHISQRNNPLLTKDIVRGIWSYVLEKIARQGGPFAGVGKTDKFD